MNKTTDTISKPAVLPQDGLTRFAAGAARSNDADDERWDLISPIGMQRLAETCADCAAELPPDRL